MVVVEKTEFKGQYIPGDNWVICDRCGFKVRASQTKYTWDGFLVCLDDWEPRHPQDLIKHVKEKIIPDKVRARQTISSFTNTTTADDL